MGRLDEIDMKILGALHRDASISIPKLSTDLGLNLSVTYSRIKRLIRRGIIQRYTLEVNEAKRLRHLEDENRQLKRVVADQVLNIQVLKDVLGKQW